MNTLNPPSLVDCVPGLSPRVSLRLIEIVKATRHYNSVACSSRSRARAAKLVGRRPSLMNTRNHEQHKRHKAHDNTT
jgi:hypothetical protein